jgi:lysophospholipase L1-like esterase
MLNQQAVDAGYDVVKPKIIARTGWTTDELLKAIEAENLDDTTFNFVSLLIGVNNQYRGYDFNRYETEFLELVDLALEFAGNDTSSVFVVSIPDYGVTPFGQAGDPEKIANELDEYNSYAEQICADRGIKYFYITDISREAADDASLIADDNLHPSGKMYKRWVDRIIPWFIEKLN